MCCDFDGDGDDEKKGFDCVRIPGAETADSMAVANSQVCGNNVGLGGTERTVCCEER